MEILSIETSCDETAAAVIEDGKKIMANLVSSSRDLHDKTGGVIPEAAAREQVKCMIPIINQVQISLRQNSGQAMFKIQNVDAIAVTVGPGLIGSLLVGVETAKALSMVLNKPLIPVNHIFAHIYANFLNQSSNPQFPAIALVVSGGHTELFYMEDEKTLRWLGGTLDDAAGEAFDKTARLLGLGYPGGPAIATEAAKCKMQNARPPAWQAKCKIKLPRPMINSKDLSFSFSGLKTAVIREAGHLQEIKQLNNLTIAKLANEIQEAITDVLVKKTLDAVIKYKVKSILVGGGVAANKRLTEKFQSEIKQLKLGIKLYVPPPNLCTDNAAYIGSYAFFHNKPVHWAKIQAQPDLEVEV